MNATQPKAVVERFRSPGIQIATGSPRAWTSFPPQATAEDEEWPTSRKARILYFWGWKEEAANSVAEPQSEAESIQRDLFALRAQWRKEDDEEDREFIRNFRNELRAFRHQDS